MSRESDLNRLDIRIDAHTNRIQELRAWRLSRGHGGTAGLDQEIAWRERWRSIQQRLRDVVSRTPE